MEPTIIGVSITVLTILAAAGIQKATPILWKKFIRTKTGQKTKRLSTILSNKMHRRSEVEILVRKCTQNSHSNILDIDLRRIGQLTSSSVENTRIFMKTINERLNSDEIIILFKSFKLLFFFYYKEPGIIKSKFVRLQKKIRRNYF